MPESIGIWITFFWGSSSILDRSASMIRARASELKMPPRCPPTPTQKGKTADVSGAKNEREIHAPLPTQLLQPPFSLSLPSPPPSLPHPPPPLSSASVLCFSAIAQRFLISVCRDERIVQSERMTSLRVRVGLRKIIQCSRQINGLSRRNSERVSA